MCTLVNFILKFNHNDYTQDIVKKYCNHLGKFYAKYDFTMVKNENWIETLYYYGVPRIQLTKEFLQDLDTRGIIYEIKLDIHSAVSF